MYSKYPYIPALAMFAGLAALALLPARAQSSLGEARILRSETRETRLAPSGEDKGSRLSFMMTKSTEEPEPKPEWNIKSQVSLAFTDFQAGGHGWNVPFEASAELGIHTFILQTDGFADVSAPQDKDGFNDILLAYKRTLWTETLKSDAPKGTPRQSLSVAAGATIPVGGDIGSKETKERCTLVFSSPVTNEVGLLFSGSVRRSEEAQKAGKNPYTQVLSALISHEQNDRSFFAQIVSVHPNHASWSSSLTAGYTFPINKKSVTLSVTRGLNAPEKDTAIQIDWGW